VNRQEIGTPPTNYQISDADTFASKLYALLRYCGTGARRRRSVRKPVQADDARLVSGHYVRHALRER